ncbi:acyl-CoA reductase [Leminorella grimontii]|uniref:acyl-CoA reductase n=1 Tax=Leminorella grimontii TaxID=82981 RepID=UPI0021C43985|nr:acyl-CoA reductase [Leminorella grimontii]
MERRLRLRPSWSLFTLYRQKHLFGRHLRGSGSMNDELQARLVKVKRWLKSVEFSDWLFSNDPDTQAFCRSRIAKLSSSDWLERKLCGELGDRTWREPYRLLLVISETDPLGTLEGFLAAYLIGSRIRIKARGSLPLLEALRQALDLSESECEIADWQSQSQDDARLLDGVDVVLLAGGDLLIRHYRAVAPAHVRLVELGPKLSAMAILGDALPPVSHILTDVCLFLQGVCSSPRFIVVEKQRMAERLFDELASRLDALPRLPDDVRLGQLAKAKALYFQSLLSGGMFKVSHSEASGWGVTLSGELSPDIWLPTGISIVYGDVGRHLEQAHDRWFGQLQTLGYWGTESALRYGGFTRYCPVGKMHMRSALAPRDGVFTLAALVTFIDEENE